MLGYLSSRPHSLLIGNRKNYMTLTFQTTTHNRTLTLQEPLVSFPKVGFRICLSPFRLSSGQQLTAVNFPSNNSQRKVTQLRFHRYVPRLCLLFPSRPGKCQLVGHMLFYTFDSLWGASKYCWREWGDGPEGRDL